MFDDELNLQPRDVVCHTLGCVNENILIEVMVDATNPLAVCGVCSVDITDIRPVAPPNE